MWEMEFYEDEVEAYQAFEGFAGPFESIYYMGCGIDRTPSEAFEGDVLHVDHDPVSVQYLTSKGLEAVEADVTEFRPEEDFDLVVISHLTSDDPLIRENLSREAYVICDRQRRAHMLIEEGFNLEAAYSEGLEEIIEIQDAQKYLFSV